MPTVLDQLPTEILLQILSFEKPAQNFPLLRAISTRFRSIIETYYDFSIQLNIPKLTQVQQSVRFHGNHPFNQIKFRDSTLIPSVTFQLIDLIESSTSTRKSTLSISIDFLSAETLNSLFAICTTRVTEIHLEIQKLYHNTPGKLSFNFLHLVSISLNSVLSDHNQSEFLLAIVEASPNLSQISLGDPFQLDDHNFEVISKFLNSPFIQNLKISLASADGHWFDQELILKLESRNVFFNKIFLRSRNNHRNSKFVYFCQKELQIVTRLLLLPRPLLTRSNFVKLKCLELYSNINSLIEFLMGCPNLEKLIWHHGFFKIKKITELNFKLLKLTRFVFHFRENKDVKILKLFSFLFPNLKIMRCIPQEWTNLSGIYENFKYLEQLELYNPGRRNPAPDIQTKETDMHLEVESGQCSIVEGSKCLRRLKFGQVQWMTESEDWTWDVSLDVFKQELECVVNVEHLTFHSMDQEMAENILDFVVTKLTKVKLVEFQVQSRTGSAKSGDGTMDREDVEKMCSKYLQYFQVKSVEVVGKEEYQYPRWLF